MIGARNRRRAGAAAALVLVLGAGIARAASEDECAAWLCITVGFAPPECAPAHTAMLKRMARFKSPLPAFASCSADGTDNGFEAQVGVAARIGNDRPPRYITGERCEYDDNNQVQGDRRPAGCTGTYRYFIVAQHGRQLGETFYSPFRDPSSERNAAATD